MNTVRIQMNYFTAWYGMSLYLKGLVGECRENNEETPLT